MAKVFMKGCEAIAESAVRAGCRFFAGYPITPQNEIPEYFARRLPEIGGTFVQGESEIASVNMIYGAAQTGTRVMISSSSTGISLYSEGISFLASARIPAVIVNVARGGPGIGDIRPAQMDYLQATKASGNGGFRMIVYVPSTVQECVDMVYEAFDVAFRDENPVMILADGVLGTMMEPVVLPEMKSDAEVQSLKDAYRPKAIVGHPLAERALAHPGNIGEDHELRNKQAAAMYETWQTNSLRAEHFMDEDADILIASYGISARVSKAAIRDLRKEGYKVGLIRPLIASPFPYADYENINFDRVKGILDVEMSIPALMKWDLEHAVRGRTPIRECLRSGGNIMTKEKVLAEAHALIKEVLG